jgi:hypothetical protein
VTGTRIWRRRHVRRPRGNTLVITANALKRYGRLRLCVGCVVVVLCRVILGRLITLFLVIPIRRWLQRIGRVTRLGVTKFRFGQIRS